MTIPTGQEPILFNSTPDCHRAVTIATEGARYHFRRLISLSATPPRFSPLLRAASPPATAFQHACFLQLFTSDKNVLITTGKFSTGRHRRAARRCAVFSGRPRQFCLAYAVKDAAARLPPMPPRRPPRQRMQPLLTAPSQPRPARR